MFWSATDWELFPPRADVESVTAINPGTNRAGQSRRRDSIGNLDQQIRLLTMACCRRSPGRPLNSEMRALRKDENQQTIVRALRAAGVRVYVLHVPCDLLCRRGDGIYLLDVDGITRYRKRDPKQLATFAEFGVRVVKTPEAALAAVGL